MNEEYIQIIPIENVVAVYKDSDGTYFTLPCIFAALTNIGNVILLTLYSTGIDEAESSNFVEYVYLDDEGKERITSYQKNNEVINSETD